MTTDHTPGLPQRICLPPERVAHWQDLLPDQLERLRPGGLEVISHRWELNTRDLTQLQTLLGDAGFSVAQLQTLNPQTAISAQAVGLQVQLMGADLATGQGSTGADNSQRSEAAAAESNGQLRIHRGTLRSGDQLETAGDLLVLGDVNPGARVSAGGDVMIWGRLRGIAHAGRFGDTNARVVALQLRPLQLRIADQVARGPDDQPQAGLAEEARIEAGEIVIEPADPRLNPRLLQQGTEEASEQSLA